MRVLIIGGSGVLSSDTVKKCVESGFKTYVLNRGNNNHKILSQVTCIKANIRDIQSVNNAVADLTFDVVIDFLSLIPAHIKSTFEIFNERCKQYIFISSADAFERTGHIITEKSLMPNSRLEYGKNKYECELYLKSQIKLNNCAITIIRPYITYGDTRIPFGIMPLAKYHGTIIKRIQENKPFFIWDDGENYCTLLHTADFANMLVPLFLNEKAFNNDFNIVGDIAYKWIDVIKLLYKILGKEPDIIKIPVNEIARIEPSFGEFLIGDRSLDAVFDNSKIKSVTGYSPTINLEQGLVRTVNFYINNDYLNGIDYVFDGKVDRLIRKFSKRSYGFIDYLGNATLYEKYLYMKNRYFNLRCRHYLNLIERKFIKKL